VQTDTYTRRVLTVIAASLVFLLLAVVNLSRVVSHDRAFDVRLVGIHRGEIEGAGTIPVEVVNGQGRYSPYLEVHIAGQPIDVEVVEVR